MNSSMKWGNKYICLLFSKMLSLSPGIPHRAIIILSLVLGGFTARSQSDTISFAPADSNFVMQISRLKGEVIISITFSDSLVFDYAAVEKRADFNAEFSQCKYIAYDEVKAKGRHLVKKDQYGYSGSNEVAYRIKLVSKEGMRIYPPISLPPLTK